MAKKRKKKAPTPKKKKVRVKSKPYKGVLKRGFGSSGSSYNAIRKKVWEENKDSFSSYKESIKASAYAYNKCKDKSKECNDENINEYLNHWAEDHRKTPIPLPNKVKRPEIDENESGWWEVEERMTLVRDSNYTGITVVSEHSDIQKFDTNDYENQFKTFIRESNKAKRPSEVMLYTLAKRIGYNKWYYYIYLEGDDPLYQSDDLEIPKDKIPEAEPTTEEPETQVPDKPKEPTADGETDADKKVKEEKANAIKRESIQTIIDKNEAVIDKREAQRKVLTEKVEKLIFTDAKGAKQIAIDKLIDKYSSEDNDLKKEISVLKAENTGLRKSIPK